MFLKGFLKKNVHVYVSDIKMMTMKYHHAELCVNN